VRFRYRPWDVPAGLLLALAGVVVAGRASRSPLLDRSPGEEDRRSDGEKGELQPDVSPERAREECETRHHEAEKLQGSPGGVHREEGES
jgi:hypothetical protein